MTRPASGAPGARHCAAACRAGAGPVSPPAHGAARGFLRSDRNGARVSPCLGRLLRVPLHGRCAFVSSMLDLLSRGWGAMRDLGIQSIAPSRPEMWFLFDAAAWLPGLVWDCYSLLVFLARSYSLAGLLVVGSSSASCQLGPRGISSERASWLFCPEV